MTAKILKLVNSGFFGVRQSITRVARAVAYLGLDTLVALALGHSLLQSAGSRRAPDGVNLEGLWQYSLQTLMAARAIALVERFPNARVALLAGMLQDVGRVVYATRGTPKTGEPAGSIKETADVIELSDEERRLYESPPEVAGKLLAAIPWLEDVAAIAA